VNVCETSLVQLGATLAYIGAVDDKLYGSVAAAVQYMKDKLLADITRRAVISHSHDPVFYVICHLPLYQTSSQMLLPLLLLIIIR